MFSISIRFGIGLDIERLKAPSITPEGQMVLLNGFIIKLPFLSIIIASEEELTHE
jgi:hypothetical protein